MTKYSVTLIWIGFVQIWFLYVLVFHHDVIYICNDYTYEQWNWIVQVYKPTEFEQNMSELCEIINVIGCLLNMILGIFTIKRLGGIHTISSQKIMELTILIIAYIITQYACAYLWEWMYLPISLLPVEFSSLLLLVLAGNFGDT